MLIQYLCAFVSLLDRCKYYKALRMRHRVGQQFSCRNINKQQKQ